MSGRPPLITTAQAQEQAATVAAELTNLAISRLTTNLRFTAEQLADATAANLPPLLPTEIEFPMTESEWLSGADPARMLRFMTAKITQRKARLFACAVCRQFWHELDGVNRNAITVAERFADGLATQDELDRATWSQLTRSARDLRAWVYVLHFIRAEEAAQTVLHNLALQRLHRNVSNADLLREIVGNPFRPPGSFPLRCGHHPGQQMACTVCFMVCDVARGIYSDRGFGDLPMFADMLEDDGCRAETVLDHLRGPNQHVRGCWALDLLLGKE